MSEIDWRTLWVDVDSHCYTNVPLDSFEQRVGEPDRFTEFYGQPCLTQKLLPAETK